jgi:L-ribulose-5-phosphate 4-epimerase
VISTAQGRREATRIVLLSRFSNATAAVKSAVMCEDVAKTTWIAKTLGPLQLIDQESIDKLYERYQNIYGQRGK